MTMKHTHLPENCPMKKADYEHYCPSPTIGPITSKEQGKCYKHEECSKIVVDFKRMGVKTTSKTLGD